MESIGWRGRNWESGGDGEARPSQVSVLGLGDTERFARHPGRREAAQKRALTADRSVESAAYGQSLEAVTG